MTILSNLHPQSFQRADKTPDKEFYKTHPDLCLLDQGASEAVKALYATLFKPDDNVLDLMAGTESHFPAEPALGHIVGVGINAESLSQNQALDKRIVIDLNIAPTLPFSDESFDIVCCCDGLAYSTTPLALLKEAWRILKPSGPIIIVFGEKFIPAKAVALWQALSMEDRQRFATLLLKQAGFSHTDEGSVQPPEHMPFWQQAVFATIGYK